MRAIPTKHTRIAILSVLLVACVAVDPMRRVRAQDPENTPKEANLTNQEDAIRKANEALAAPANDPGKEPATSADGSEPSVNFLELIVKGGWLMVPIAVMSFVVVAVAVERTLGLRRSKIMPPDLIQGLNQITADRRGFDPRRAYRLCRQFPSTASTVIGSMLLKVGRPQLEVEHMVTESRDREAGALFKNVRTLNLASAVTPLLGLLGTVWGMIKAFFATANLPVGANKAEHLAEGIYVALVTTFAGLAVAIPAAVLAHVFEGRIQNLLREIDHLIVGILPYVERLEGHSGVNPLGDKLGSGEKGREGEGEMGRQGEGETPAPDFQHPTSNI